MHRQLDPTNPVGRYFGRSAVRYHAHATLQRQIASALSQRYCHLLAPHSILELGCGTGFLTSELARRFPQASLEAIDLSPEMIEFAQANTTLPQVAWQVADMNDFQGEHRFDLIASSTALHWGEPLGDLLRHLRGQLTPGGHLAAAVMAADTLAELHAVRQVVAPQKLPLRRLPCAAELREHLQAAELQILDLTTINYREGYPSACDLLEKLRNTAFTGGPFSRLDGDTLSRRELAALIDCYQEHYSDGQGRVSASYQVVYLLAKAPA